MSIASYLPSAQFSVILTSILFAAGLVWAADYYTSPPSPPSIAPASTPSALTQGLDWQKTLATIQGEETLPQPPDEETVNSLLAASESTNITSTIGRSILISLGEAKAQGLGSDIPTQERIVENALAKVESVPTGSLYTSAELITVEDGPATLRTYGNNVISVLEQHPEASVEDALLAIGKATDSGDPASLAALATVANAYRVIGNELAALSVPKTLSPLHLQVVNNFLKIGVACEDMRAVLTDPLRGLAGLRSFQTLTEETNRLFINIAEALRKNGILFSEGEPGYAWSLLIGL